jgi:hypothetical protein
MRIQTYLSLTWGFIKSASGGAVLAVIGLTMGIYSLSVDQQAKLRFRTLSLSSVFDVHQSVGGLEISYGGENLRDTKRTLWSATLIMTNNGKASIKKGDFDESSPIGLVIKNGEIVDKPTFKGNSNYLDESFRIATLKGDLTIAPLILEPGDAIEINMLILGPERSPPHIEAKGKIAGVKAIEFAQPDVQHDEKNWLYRLIGAESWLVQLMRGPIYAIAFLLEIIVVVSFLSGIRSIKEKLSAKAEKEERKKWLSEYKYKPEIDNGEANGILTQMYLDEGKTLLSRLARIKHALAKRQQLASELRRTQPQEEIALICKRRYPTYPGDRALISDLIKLGTIDNAEGIPRITPALSNAIDSLTLYLSIDTRKQLLILEDYWEQDDVRLIPEKTFARTRFI